jgi:hypothetical protein
MIPVSEHAPHLNSVSNGSGFCNVNDMLGRPPVLFLFGHQADISSSNSFLTDVATTFFNYSISQDIM